MRRKKCAAPAELGHRSSDDEIDDDETSPTRKSENNDNDDSNQLANTCGDLSEFSRPPEDDDAESAADDNENDSCHRDEPCASSKKAKKSTPGVVYLSYIPKGLSVAKAREILGEFGDIGRMYFEPAKKLDKKTRPNHCFTEGWVEFKKKKVAKKVAELLNAKPVGGKRRTAYHDCLWSIKYLHRFRWTHLSERLAYEKAVKDQRLRTEIAKAKREASYYAKALERSIRMRKRRRLGEVVDEHPSNIKLRKTDREIREQKPEPGAAGIADKTLLLSIFAKE